MEKRIKDIIAKHLAVRIEEVTNTALLMEDLGADELDSVELVMAFEEEFKIDIVDGEFEKLLTVGDIIKHVTDKTK